MISPEVALRENVVWQAKNRIVYVVYHGDQTFEKMALTARELRLFCVDMQARQEPTLILVDTRDLDECTPEAKDISMRIRTELPFWRMAIIVRKNDANTMLSISHQMNSVSAKRKEIAYFDSLPDARRWLGQLRNDEDIFHFLQPLEFPYKPAM